jgi:hypothetical protein
LKIIKVYRGKEEKEIESSKGKHKRISEEKYSWSKVKSKREKRYE